METRNSWPTNCKTIEKLLGVGAFLNTIKIYRFVPFNVCTACINLRYLNFGLNERVMLYNTMS